MRAIVLPRMGGKTERMLSWLITDPHHVLVVMSARERDRLVQLFVGEGAEPNEMYRIVSISEVTSGATRGRWPEPVYGIDEVDHVLSLILRGPVEVVTFTGTVES